MKDQHTHIKGYRDLSETEIALINEVKTKGKELGALIAKLQANATLDQRWVSIARTHYQEGGMAAVRSIAQPTTF